MCSVMEEEQSFVHISLGEHLCPYCQRHFVDVDALSLHVVKRHVWMSSTLRATRARLSAPAPVLMPAVNAVPAPQATQKLELVRQ
jgi:uncharacterized C2H2 Zn-finger protein